MRPGPPPRLLVAVAAGGAAGALLRWLAGELVPDGDLPWTTLTVNVVGSFALGLLPALSGVRRRPALGAALGPGLLGGFTTMSTWAEQSRALLEAGRPGAGLAYALGTALACIAAAALAAAVVDRTASHR